MDKFVFGITGATGSGKTTVSNLFRDLGVYVADADMAARAVTKKGSECLSEIHAAFGDAVITDTGELNRKALADIVFNNKSKLKLLNDITHKYIKKHLCDEIKNCDSDIAAIDGAVIIGSPVMDMCKALAVVTADIDIRVARICNRDNIDSNAAISRIKSQMTDDEYVKYADFVIENNDGFELGECVEDIYNKIKNIAKTTITQSSTQT